MDFPVYDWNNDFETLIKAMYLSDRPFIVKSFFNEADGLPASEEELKIQMGDREFEVQRFDLQDFITQIKSANYIPLKKETLSFNDYKISSSTLKTGENLILEEWAAPLASKINEAKIKSVLPQGTNEDHYFRFFLGFKGQVTDPHVDWVPYHNILFQLYGEKEVLLISPDEFHKIPFIANFSELDFDSLAHVKQLRVTLNAGEGLFIPPYFLHGIKYLSDSASLSLRMLPILKNEKSHRHLPPNAELAVALSKGKSEQEVMDLFEAYQKNHSQYALNYEKYLFEKMKSFETPLSDMTRKRALLDRGACYFRSLKK